MFLARTWFHCTVEDMLARVDSAQLAQMQAEYLIEPWGEPRGDLQAGIVACTITNAARAMAGGRRGRDRTPLDFMPKFGGAAARTKHRKTWEDVRAYLVGYTKAVGGKVRSGNGKRDQQAIGSPGPEQCRVH